MRRLFIGLGGAALLMGALTAQVAARAETETSFWWNQTYDLGAGFEQCLPSDDPVMTLTITVSGKAHFTDTGTVFIGSGEQHGTFVLDPEDPALSNFYGSYRDNISFNFNAFGGSFVFDIRLVGSSADGLKLVSIAHLKYTLTSGGVKVDLININCGA